MEATSPQRESVTFDIEHFVMDGIINLYNLDRGDKRIRALEIFKMRGTDHSRELVPFKVLPERNKGLCRREGILRGSVLVVNMADDKFKTFIFTALLSALIILGLSF